MLKHTFGAYKMASGFSDGRSPVSEDIKPAMPLGIKAKLSERKENPRQRVFEENNSEPERKNALAFFLLFRNTKCCYLSACFSFFKYISFSLHSNKEKEIYKWEIIFIMSI